MSKYQPYPDEVLETYVMVGCPKAEAFLWLTRYVENLNEMIRNPPAYETGTYTELTVDELIEIGMQRVEDSGRWHGYIIKGSVFEGVSLDMTYWDKLSALMEVDIPSNKRDQFFSCSC